MKKLMVALVAVAALSASAELKVGTVEMMTLVRNHPQYESNKKLLQDTEKDYQRDIDAIKKEAEKLSDEGRKMVQESQNPMLSAAAKSKLEKDIGEVQQKLMAYQQRLRAKAMSSQEELQKLEGRMLKATTEDLHKKIDGYAAEKGYDFIFDKSAVPFAKASFDVTDEILVKLGVDPKTAKKGAADEGK